MAQPEHKNFFILLSIVCTSYMCYYFVGDCVPFIRSALCGRQRGGGDYISSFLRSRANIHQGTNEQVVVHSIPSDCDHLHVANHLPQGELRLALLENSERTSQTPGENVTEKKEEKSEKSNILSANSMHSSIPIDEIDVPG